jgi:hypothetical protein
MSHLQKVSKESLPPLHTSKTTKSLRDGFLCREDAAAVDWLDTFSIDSRLWGFLVGSRIEQVPSSLLEMLIMLTELAQR